MSAVPADLKSRLNRCSLALYSLLAKKDLGIVDFLSMEKPAKIHQMYPLYVCFQVPGGLAHLARAHGGPSPCLPSTSAPKTCYLTLRRLRGWVGGVLV